MGTPNRKDGPTISCSGSQKATPAEESVGPYEEKFITTGLDSNWWGLDCFSSLRNHRNILHPIRTKYKNCSYRFIDCADADVFLLLATA
jgi:hypothetical protein